MLMNLTDMFTSEGKVKNVSVPYERDSFSSMGNEYPITDRSEAGFTLTNAGQGRVVVEGELQLTLSVPCDRCLQSVAVPLTMTFSHEVAAPEGDGGISENTSDEEQCFVSGYELDTDTLIDNEILIQMPVKVLCREDCKGICPTCGRNLNEGECGCDNFVPDPRMAAIKDIFNANKEV